MTNLNRKEAIAQLAKAVVDEIYSSREELLTVEALATVKGIVAREGQENQSGKTG